MIFNYSTQNYFPNHVKFFGFILIVFGLASLFVFWILGLISLALGLVFATTKYGLSIDTGIHRYKDYLEVCGIKSGQFENYEQIEKIYVTSGYVSVNFQTHSKDASLRKYEYNAYVKFGEYQKIHLLSSTDKSEIFDFIKPIARDLSVSIQDLSDELH